MTRPKTTARTYGKGSAAKQDAIRKGKVAASKAKLDAIVARQECVCCGDDVELGLYRFRDDTATVCRICALIYGLRTADGFDARGHWHGGPEPCPVCGGQRPG